MTSRKIESPPAPTVVIEHYRDLSDVDHLIKSKPGMFWCYTHLQDLPLEKQSPYPRYCQQCYELLMAEYRDTVKVRGKRRLWWAPVNGDKVSRNDVTPQVVGKGAVIMSTVKPQNSTVDIINPSVPITAMPVFIDGRGRKPTDLPVEQIIALAAQGMGSKKIAARLFAQGLTVSYKTIQRRLKKMLIGRRTTV